jgi:hypothetical protein
LVPSDIDGHLRLLGLVDASDPPRGKAREALDQCRTAGIRVKMIAGDHIATAIAIARELGLVTALQDQGAIVATTGDGVNDAPALKRADRRPPRPVNESMLTGFVIWCCFSWSTLRNSSGPGARIGFRNSDPVGSGHVRWSQYSN